ncbi:MAG: biosynthetic-type acetolactate synthase large subunit [Candidatus Methanomethylophilaceae archaeon]
MKGSRALLKMLEDRNVEYVFGYPGATVIPIYDEFIDSSVRHVLVRHEQCAAHMADAYARASGIPGVCLSTSGPGVTNLVTGIATAYADSSPMIALTGQVGTGSLGMGAFQEIDAYSLMMPVTKHNYRVLTPDKLPHILEEAWDICQTGRPGPVHIDLPVDQLSADIDDSLLTAPYGIKPVKEDTSRIPDAVKLIREAQKPVIIVGGGVIGGNASKEIIRLAEMTNTSVVTPLMGVGAIPWDHPLYLGPLGMHGKLGALDAFSHADLIIAIGTRFSDRTYSPHTAPGENCKVVHIDIDATEFGKSNRDAVNILCDAKKGTQMLIDALSGYTDGHTKWHQTVSDYRKRCCCDQKTDAYPINPKRVMYEINQIINDDMIITTDVGQNQMWAMHYLHISKPRQFISSGSMGTMGFGLPSALGAKAAKPDKTVMTIVGDGGLQMVIQELATSVAENLPVVICLLNNGWLGMVRQHQKFFWNKRYSGVELGDDPDFCMIAKAYGAVGIPVEKPGEIKDALKEAVDCGKTCIVDIKTDCEADMVPMIPGKMSQDIFRDGCCY